MDRARTCGLACRSASTVRLSRRIAICSPCADAGTLPRRGGRDSCGSAPVPMRRATRNEDGQCKYLGGGSLCIICRRVKSNGLTTRDQRARVAQWFWTYLINSAGGGLGPRCHHYRGHSRTRIDQDSGLDGQLELLELTTQPGQTHTNTMEYQQQHTNTRRVSTTTHTNTM